MIEFIDVLLVALTGAVLFWHAVESAAWRAERADLLNRIMARSYTEFVYAEPATEKVEMPQMLTDEDEVAWHEKNRREHPELYPADADLRAIV